MNPENYCFDLILVLTKGVNQVTTQGQDGFLNDRLVTKSKSTQYIRLKTLGFVFPEDEWASSVSMGTQQSITMFPNLAGYPIFGSVLRFS